MSETITEIRMKPAHPGEFIRADILDELGLSLVHSAAALGVRRATLSDLTPACAQRLALRIEKAFGARHRCS